MLRRFCAAAIAFVIVCAESLPAFSGEPLHHKIDKLVEATHLGPLAMQVGDAEYLRRLSLDLLGVIPSSDDVRAFLADKSPDKRTKVLDRILSSDRHARHMVEWLDTVLMERRPHRWVPEAEFQAFLFDFYKANKPYRDLIRELLTCDGGDLAKRGPARFVLDREADPNVVTRDIGRLFFGRDIQCAQCHDHPNIDDYLQSEFHGLAAFLNRSYLFPIDENNRKAAIGEKAEGDITYNSVFQPASKFTAKPHLPGEGTTAEPVVAKGKEYKTKPDAKNRGVPTFSRRELLALTAAQGKNIWFNRNIANRLWALMMGRGLVHPVDYQHSDNPPANPELLDLLANDFAAHGHDIRYFLRELALSRAYQRGFDLPDNLENRLAAVAAEIPHLEERDRIAKAAVSKQQSVVAKAKSAIKKSDKELSAARKQLDAAQALVVDANKAIAAAEKPLNDAKSLVANKKAATTALAEAAAKADAAAKLLAADKDLAQTAANLQTKAKKLAAETEVATKALAGIKPVPPELRQKLADAKAAANLAGKAVTTIEERLAVMRTSFYSESDILGNLKTTWRHAQRRLASANSYLDYGKASDRLRQMQSKPNPARVELAAMDRKLHDCEAKVAAAKTALVAAQANVVRAESDLAFAKSAVAERQVALRDLIAKLEPMEASARTMTQLASNNAAGNAALAKAAHTETIAALDRLRINLGRTSAQVGACEDRVVATEARAHACKAQADSAAKSFVIASSALANIRKDRELVHTRFQQHQVELAKIEAAHEAAKTTLIENWTTESAVAALKPLSPEQLGWSSLQATGVIANYRNQAVVELSKPKSPPAAKPAQNTVAGKSQPKKAAKELTTRLAKTAKTATPTKPASAAPPAPPSQQEVDTWVYNKLKPSLAEFTRLYGGSPGSPQDVFFSAADQALFLANGGTMNSWIGPSGSNLAARATKAKDTTAVAEEIYLGILSRLPSADEIQEVAHALAKRPKERNAVIQEIAWSLLASVEFRFNH